MFGFNHLLKEIQKMSKQLQELTDAILVLGANVQTLIALKTPPPENLAAVTAQVKVLNDLIVSTTTASPATGDTVVVPAVGAVIEHTNPATPAV